jgi:RimJ/RimL family protein N-acetyltransferase
MTAVRHRRISAQLGSPRVPGESGHLAGSADLGQLEEVAPVVDPGRVGDVVEFGPEGAPSRWCRSSHSRGDEIVELRAFAEADLAVVERWFDRGETSAFLGGRDWPRLVLQLQGHTGAAAGGPPWTVSRTSWVGVVGDELVGLVDLEVFDDGSASLALVVDPDRRNRGHGRAILAALEFLDVAEPVRRFVACVAPTNKASIRCAHAAGYRRTENADLDGFLELSKFK